MSFKQTVLMTGATGLVGTTLRSRLRRPGRTIRLVGHRTKIENLAEGEEYFRGSFIDMGQMEEACRGVDAVIDLARFEIGEKHSVETWELVTEVNIRGAHTMYEAARRQGVKRFIYASSNHAVGFYPRPKKPLGEYLSPLPDTHYGVGKVLGEALGSLYYNRFGMEVICVRIGSQFPKPTDVRMLSTWFSPDDTGRCYEACLTTPNPGYRIIWGVSNNTRGFFSLKEGREIGYEPQDDSEVYAAELVEKFGEISEGDPLLKYVGGVSTILP